jgi:hypothetical protein
MPSAGEFAWASRSKAWKYGREGWFTPGRSYQSRTCFFGFHTCVRMICVVSWSCRALGFRKVRSRRRYLGTTHGDLQSRKQRESSKARGHVERGSSASVRASAVRWQPRRQCAPTTPKSWTLQELLDAASGGAQVSFTVHIPMAPVPMPSALSFELLGKCSVCLTRTTFTPQAAV